MTGLDRKPLRLAIAGLGTVGAGVIRLLEENRALVEARAGRPITIAAVSARDRTKDRGVDLSGFAWCDDMAEMAKRDDVDVVVELVGGSDGPTLALARDTLAAGKGLVTANKAMIAHHGMELAGTAETNGAGLRFEAAVAGGIPVVKGLREGASANAIDRVYGILNGTCNYILTAMESSGADFGETLADAQRLGFAEADPAFDIDGVDAAHKLAILAALSFGAQIDFESVEIDGIRRVRAADIAQADALGYVVRLIGVADVEQSTAGPRMLQRVRPCLVAKDHPLAPIDGPTNAVVAEGNFSGRLLFQGAGAGDGPTASAVVADLIDLARGDAGAAFSVPTQQLVAMPKADSGARESRSYIRFTVADRPGVLAEITAAMRDAGVSIQSLIQEGEADGADGVLVAMVTHQGPVRNVRAAIEMLAGSDSLTDDPLIMPILRS
ncbi:homoserine dehydrogenase [Parerythrobacter jejuensis]|uniref:Homoserine dehydrogenase n=1 Tax=Parerythrobacter jejuensis TaxID=795812 RepID=A0A845ATC6_9SPHN|nr:homoserine dehydrogenase [Parerythrobacter jejuensis]MXP30800.1 homoserine dehydrogenase [Parerythrobacter jejuensis]MXP33560.1 homoserine dehydrogenase [Parerythrobacter jejuensis]